MSNMSYCRFENTAQDLQDCIDSLDNFNGDKEEGYENLSRSEKSSADEMREMCETYIRIYDEVEEAAQEILEESNNNN